MSGIPSARLPTSTARLHDRQVILALEINPLLGVLAVVINGVNSFRSELVRRFILFQVAVEIGAGEIQVSWVIGELTFLVFTPTVGAGAVGVSKGYVVVQVQIFRRRDHIPGPTVQPRTASYGAAVLRELCRNQAAENQQFLPGILAVTVGAKPTAKIAAV